MITSVLLLWACESVPPAERMFSARPDPDAASAPAELPRVPGEPTGPDAIAAGTQPAPDVEPVPPAELYRGLGLGSEPPAPSAPAAAPPPEPPPQAIQPGTLWLVSTVANAVPPRAIVGAPDGTERVVRPGTVLEDLGIVVLAIGVDVAHVAVVVPDGDHAVLEPRQLTAMYPRP